MSIWGLLCLLDGHIWRYRKGYRVCVECDKIERLP